MFQLSLFARGERLYDMRLDAGPLQIGRDARNDLVLADNQIAPFHAALRRRGGQLELVAREGRVSILRDGAEADVDRAWLEPPAVFRVGRFELAVDAAGGCHTVADLGDGRGDTATGFACAEPSQLALRHEPDGAVVPLPKGALRIGKATDNDLVFDDPFVSKQHCRILERNGRHVLYDSESRNGTYVNGVRVGMIELQAGLRLLVGQQEMTVVKHGGARERRNRVQRFHGMLSADPQLHALFERIKRVAAGDIAAVVFGETGTGKELVAQALHQAGPRAKGPFVAINCGAVSPTLVESELFGHERGAFTGAVSRRRGVFEEAHGGTLFLDEIGELPLALQPKLLRALETRKIRRVGADQETPFDVRLVAATHRDLAGEIREGRFRADLYHRLAGVELKLPPLRARAGDVAVLIHEFLVQERGKHGVRSVTSETLEALAQYPWPGNVRELRNAVARAVAEGDAVLGYADFVGVHALAVGEAGAGAAISVGGRRLADIEREAIELELARQGGNRRRAAAVLGVARSTLGDKLRRLRR